MSHCKKYLICYDISDPKRLRRVHRTLRDFGVPVQYSVFEAELHPRQLNTLLKQLTTAIVADEDKVAFYPLSPGHAKICLGQADTACLMWV